MSSADGVRNGAAVASPVLLGGSRPHGRARLFTAGLPSLTVLMVVRNGAATIRTAIDSVLGQDFSNAELVIVDGASTDGTPEILAGYGDRIDHWISEPDSGIFDAMNKAVAQAHGDWLLFLGCDDRLLAPLSRIADCLRDRSAIYYGNVWIPGRAIAYAGPFSRWTLLKRNICHQAILYPRSVFDRHQFKTEYAVLADWELNLRCFADSAFRFEYIPELIAEYNGTTGHSSRTKDPRFDRDHSAIISETLPRLVYYWHLAKAPARLFKRVLAGSGHDAF
jgi:glycosyltransferase involved in cell wall biosynthesis